MMNENLCKCYAELVEIRNGLRTAENDGAIKGYMKRLEDCTVYLQTEDEYAPWAATLENAVQRYNSGDSVITMEYIIKYADKLAELIEVTTEPEETGKTFAQIRDEAKATGEKIASTVQLGYQTARDRIKSEGPIYAAGAASVLRGFGKKIEDGLRNWAKDDEAEPEGEATDNTGEGEEE